MSSSRIRSTRVGSIKFEPDRSGAINGADEVKARPVKPRRRDHSWRRRPLTRNSRRQHRHSRSGDSSVPVSIGNSVRFAAIFQQERKILTNRFNRLQQKNIGLRSKGRKPSSLSFHQTCRRRLEKSLVSGKTGSQGIPPADSNCAQWARCRRRATCAVAAERRGTPESATGPSIPAKSGERAFS